MAEPQSRATVRSLASNDSRDRRRRGALVALIGGATLSAATLGSGVFASSTPAPLTVTEAHSTAQSETPDAASAAIASPAGSESAADDEIRRIAVDATEPAPLSSEESDEIESAIRALANDDIPRNAMEAVRTLRAAREKAVPALLRALESFDEQQRHLAAFVLRWIDAEPTTRLCELSIEALGDPEIEGYWRTLIHRPAVSAARWLDDHSRSKEVTSHLLVAARSQQPQRRFLAAALLARSGTQVDLNNTCSVLIAQLPDNEDLGDALVAAHGLYRLGPAALPQVRMAYRGADAQAYKLLQLVEENLADDAAGKQLTEAELRARYDRLGLRTVTDARIDPARGHPFLGLAVLPRL